MFMFQVYIVWRLVSKQDYLSYEIILLDYSTVTTFCGASTEQVQE